MTITQCEPTYQPVHMHSCTSDTTLSQAIRQLAANNLHRLWVVDTKNRPVGVVALLDIMKALMLSNNQTHHIWERKISVPK